MNRPTIFVDLDGVLADWCTPALRVMGYDPAEVYSAWDKLFPRPWNIFDVIDATPAQGWALIDQAGEDFWANLPLKPYAHELISRCESIGETMILTAPSLHPSSYAGKVRWLDRHFGKGFARSRALLGATKRVVARSTAAAHSEAVLIDDSPAHCREWGEAGGRAILFPAPGNRLHAYTDTALSFIGPQLKHLREVSG